MHKQKSLELHLGEKVVITLEVPQGFSLLFFAGNSDSNFTLGGFAGRRRMSGTPEGLRLCPENKHLFILSYDLHAGLGSWQCGVRHRGS